MFTMIIFIVSFLITFIVSFFGAVILNLTSSFIKRIIKGF
jgi:hypothetical protein